MGDDFLREAKAGRVIVTNVRGVTRDRVIEQFPDLPDSFDVMHVGDKTEEERLKWAQWFHWVPKGAFLFIDEVQDIWPKRWREADIRALDYPGGVLQAGVDDRPKDWEQAFDKHRHWNWDMVLTTPSYRKVRDDVKGAAEMAYKHKNLGILGGIFRGSYIEAAHLADDDGGSASHFLNVQKKKVPGYVFKLYDSTATGVVTDTKAGISIFSNPRILLLLGILAIAIFFVIRGALSGSMSIIGVGSKSDSSVVPSAAVASVPAGSVPGSVPGRGDGGPSRPPVANSLDVLSMTIAASIRAADGWRYVFERGGVYISSSQFIESGGVVVPRGSCTALVMFESSQKFVECSRMMPGDQTGGL